jgi:hypothetical protein
VEEMYDRPRQQLGALSLSLCGALTEPVRICRAHMKAAAVGAAVGSCRRS